MDHDLNKYLDAARAQCAVNRTKWGRQSEETLYCVLTEQWGQFVQAVNRWRFPGRGGNIVEVQYEAVKALAVIVDMGYDANAPLSRAAHERLRGAIGIKWHGWMAMGNEYLGAGNEQESMFCLILAMLAKALNENAREAKP
jgi:hypothetical protein